LLFSSRYCIMKMRYAKQQQNNEGLKIVL